MKNQKAKTKNPRSHKLSTLRQPAVHRRHRRKDSGTDEPDGLYFLKLAVYLVFGALWLKVSHSETSQVPIPVGLLLGLVLASHDHIQLDRKIGYAVLLIAAFVGFWLPFGIFVGV